MVFKNNCLLVLWMKVALALEGLIYQKENNSLAYGLTIMVKKVTMITIPFHSMSSDVPCLSCAMLAMYKRYDNRLFLSVAAARLMRMVTADSYHCPNWRFFRKLPVQKTGRTGPG